MNARRWPVLLILLALTVAAAVLDWPGVEPEESRDVLKKVESRQLPKDIQTEADSRERAVTAATETGARFSHSGFDLFAAVDFQPKPVVHRAAPLPAPVAPPLPFRYQGKSIEGSRVSVFLAEGARTHVIRVGSVLGNYRVEEISNSAATLVFLPLNEKQQILFGSAN